MMNFGGKKSNLTVTVGTQTLETGKALESFKRDW